MPISIPTLLKWIFSSFHSPLLRFSSRSGAETLQQWPWQWDCATTLLPRRRSFADGMLILTGPPSGKANQLPASACSNSHPASRGCLLHTCPLASAAFLFPGHLKETPFMLHTEAMWTSLTLPSKSCGNTTSALKNSCLYFWVKKFLQRPFLSYSF